MMGFSNYFEKKHTYSTFFYNKGLGLIGVMGDTPVAILTSCHCETAIHFSAFILSIYI